MRNLLRRARRNHHAAMLPRTGTHIDHEVSRPDGILIMFDDNNRIAQISKSFQCGDKTLVITLMKSDGRLVENIKYAHESRADLSRQPNTLGLTAREKGGSRTFERQVAEADVDDKLQSGLDPLHNRSGDTLVLPREGQPLEKLERFARRYNPRLPR